MKVISAKESIAEGSEGILLESVLEGMAEYYSVELSEKILRGMTENALKVLNDDALLDVLTDRIYELQAEENPRLPYLKEQLSDVEKKIMNILSAIEQGAFSEAINERLSSLEKSKKDIETAIIQKQIKRPFLTKEQIRFGIEKFKTLDIDTQDGRQRLIDGFINAVYLYDDKITIIFNYKDSTTTVSIDEYKSSDNKTKTAPNEKQTGYYLSAFHLEHEMRTRRVRCPSRRRENLPRVPVTGNGSISLSGLGQVKTCPFSFGARDENSQSSVPEPQARKSAEGSRYGKRQYLVIWFGQVLPVRFLLGHEMRTRRVRCPNCRRGNQPRVPVTGNGSISLSGLGQVKTCPLSFGARDENSQSPVPEPQARKTAEGFRYGKRQYLVFETGKNLSVLF